MVSASGQKETLKALARKRRELGRQKLVPRWDNYQLVKLPSSRRNSGRVLVGEGVPSEPLQSTSQVQDPVHLKRSVRAGRRHLLAHQVAIAVHNTDSLNGQATSGQRSTIRWRDPDRPRTISRNWLYDSQSLRAPRGRLATPFLRCGAAGIVCSTPADWRRPKERDQEWCYPDPLGVFEARFEGEC